MKLTKSHEHPWNLTPQEATCLQEKLRPQVLVQPLTEQSLSHIGGVDASFSKSTIYAAAVVLDFATLKLVDQATIRLPVMFPYIPGLLSFREAPAILRVLEQLSILPDVLIVDGHGLAHPRRFGIACHVGVLLDLPTIGCAKSVLVGEYAHMSETVGSFAELRENDEVIGLALRTRSHAKPIYISIGHRVDLASAVRIVLSCTGAHRLPQPARLAHQLAMQAKST